MPAPVVAVVATRLASGRVRGWRKSGLAAPEAYVRALQRAGARALLVTLPEPAPAAEVLAPFAGLLLMGGGDVDPQRYGADPHPSVYGIEPDRDEVELKLVSHAVDAGLPVLAICRGAQVLNVALGGTLRQHLPDDPALIVHGSPVIDETVSHDIELAPGSRVAKACGRDIVSGTSHHHQSVDRLGRNLVARGWSADGLVEAIEPESSSDPWVVGVQWHPEDTAATDPAQQALFDGFVEAARTVMSGG